MSLDTSVWAAVLAGGDGTRLQKLSLKIDGDARPKQFSSIFGARSLLGHTRERLRRICGDESSYVCGEKRPREVLQKRTCCNKGPYNNHAFYEDELVKRDGAWRFARRSYRYVWIDIKSPIGGDVIG